MAIRRSHKSRSKKNRKPQRNSHKNAARHAFHVETLEERQLLAVGPQLVGINPNEGEVLRNGDIRHVAPLELTIRFDDGQVIDPNSLGGIRITRSGLDNQFQNQNGVQNDILVTPGYIGIGEHSNEVVVRFAAPLPDDLYRIDIVGSGATPLKNTSGDLFDNDRNQTGTQDARLEFSLDLGAQIVAVVPQPITRNPVTNQLSQARNQIQIYFNDDDLLRTAGASSRATNPVFYQLIFTNDTATNADDVVFNPTTVAYDPVTDSAVLTFSNDLAALGGAGTYRLRIGTAETAPLAPLTTVEASAGSSYSTAQVLNFNGTRGLIVSGEIEPQAYVLDLPGAEDEPGHRNITAESHIGEIPVLEDLEGKGEYASVADTTDGVTTIYYNFRDVYGTDPFGNTLHNLITSTQKQRAREVFSFYAYYGGVQFVETADQGFTIVTGDMRALDPTIATGPGGVAGLAGESLLYGPMAIMDNAETWDDAFGENWFQVAMHEVGHLLGLGHSYDLPPLTIQGEAEYENPDGEPLFGVTAEAVFPGDHDITHIRHLYRPDSVDIDLYKFQLTQSGLFTAETIAERLNDSSLLDAVVTLYRETSAGREVIARNNNYFSEDSFLELQLGPGTYYIGVSAAGNEDFDPTIENTGIGGTTQGKYDLRLNFRPEVTNAISDTTGTLLDGDGDGLPGGVHNFWFRAVNAADQIIVDNTSTSATQNGTLANPYKTISAALAVATSGKVVRIVGNAGADRDLSTLQDNVAYEIGFDRLSQPLKDGSSLSVPKNVTVMIDANAIIKLRRASINVGSFAAGLDRSGGALQVLGTPRVLDGGGGLVLNSSNTPIAGSVYFTSLDDEAVGVDSNPTVATTPRAGDWGGIRFRGDLDRSENAASAVKNRKEWEELGIFLNYVNQADIRYGGGSVVINSVSQVVNPIDMVTARPTVTNNRISNSSDAAMAANPDAFEETNFHAPKYQTTSFTSDYDRIGPEIHGNLLSQNTTNGLFVRIKTPAGSQLQPLTVAGRWDDSDIVHILTEALDIAGAPGGPILNETTGALTARLDASLVVDPGVIVKLDGARISTGMGAQLIAEGTAGRHVVFTSILDDRYGAGGVFDTNSNGATRAAAAGNWGGLYFGPASTGSLDYAVIAYGGGLSRVESTFAGFNAVEIHQADVRIAHSTLESNASGLGGQAPAGRYGRGENFAGAIFARGAQPIIIENIIRNTVDGAAITINVNALNADLVTDRGRQRGLVDRYGQKLDNQGALVRGNRLANNLLNGMVVRGGVMTTEGVWDDTDIAHLLFSEVIVPNLHTYGGLRLESSAGESLVVKLWGDDAGFTAGGTPLDIVDRIGGMLHIVGQPGSPVVFTSLRDDSVGAGFRPDGKPQTDANNDGAATAAAAGDWRSIKLDQYAHDRNVQVVVEQESASVDPPGVNGYPDTAQYLGSLAPNLKAGDETRRLGFQVQGFLHKPNDIDVYSFTAQGGTEIWLDVDRTTYGLDAVVELIDANGQTIVLSDNSYYEGIGEQAIWNGPEGLGDGRIMDKSGFLLRDFYGTNPKDPGLRVRLPGASDTTGTYHVRVRSSSPDVQTNLGGGLTSGVYQLQIRLQEVDEFPGSTVQYADIRYAENGVEVIGLPAHSPLIGETVEDSTTNDTQANAQNVGNVLNSDRGVISIGGKISGSTDVDWYKFELTYEAIQGLGGAGLASMIFDLDYAEGLARVNARVSVFDSSGKLVLTTNDSNISDDLPGPLQGNDMDDLNRGSASILDPYIGNVLMTAGTYYVAVSSNAQLPQQVEQFLIASPVNPLLRLEPVDSVIRIAEDHIGSSGGSTAADPKTPFLLDASSAVPYFLGDVVLFVSQNIGLNGTGLATVDPFSGVVETSFPGFTHNTGDIAMRPDGKLFTFQLGVNLPPYPTDANSGDFYEINTGTGAVTFNGNVGAATGVIKYEFAPDGTVTTSLDPAPAGDNDRTVGWQNTAMTFVGEHGYGVFHWGDHFAAGVTDSVYTNMLFRYDPSTGVVTTLNNSWVGLDDETIFFDGGNRIDTDFSAGGNDAIRTVEATSLNNGVATRILRDGVDFTLTINGVATTFELDAGVELNVNVDPESNRFIRDGEFLLLNGNRYEFDTGEVIVVTGNGSVFQDGAQFTVTNATGGMALFEFDNNNSYTNGSVPIAFDLNDTPADMGDSIVAAITAAAIGVTAEIRTGRITLTGDGNVDMALPVAGMGIIGDYGISSGTRIAVEENFSANQVLSAIYNVTRSSGEIVGLEGTRINFPDAASVDTSGVQFITRFGAGVDGAAGNNIPINFLAQDTATQIAVKIADAVNAALGAGSATARNEGVAFIDGATVIADAPLVVTGSAPGGFVTGIAFIGDQLYAVSDTGGLFRVNNYNGDIVTQYIRSSEADLLGIDFAGLVAGPPDVENGRYAETLLAIDESGVIYAFNTDGELQPIFQDGATSIETGITGAEGLAFSTLDENLWHMQSKYRSADAGHGLNAAFDGSRGGSTGGTTYYFGDADKNNYEFPGGAHGSLITETFDLAGYVAGDLPTLYFNYFLDTDGKSNGVLAQDAFRVYASGDDGVWHLLATNNVYAPEKADPDSLDDTTVVVQDLFDNSGSWRQARVDLSPFAGRSNLRLRFDFSTAASFDLGNPDTAGIELRALDGATLRDGDVFTIGGVQFEFDSEYTFEVPSGAGVADGSGFTVDDGVNPPVAFQFDRDGVVAVNSMTAVDGSRLTDGMSFSIDEGAGPVTFEFDSGYVLRVPANGGLGIVDGATFVMSNGVGGPNITFEFDSNNSFTAGNVRIQFTSLNTADELAQRVKTAIQTSGLGLTPTNYAGGVVHVGGTTHTLDVAQSGLALSGQPGVSAGALAIPFKPDVSFTADQVAAAVASAITSSPLILTATSNAATVNLTATAQVALGQVPFTSPGNFIRVTHLMTADQVAQALENALYAAGLSGLTTHRNGPRLNVIGMDAITVTTPGAWTLEGEPGGNAANLIHIHAGMTAEEVAQQMAPVIEAVFSQGQVENIARVNKDMVRILGHAVTDAGPLGLSQTENTRVELQGDQYGTFNTIARGQDNAHEGVYIDDITIGFAERGEMATGATVGTAFRNNPNMPANEILVGEYQLEIRRAEEYSEGSSLERSFDTNDRLASATTLVAPAGNEIADGDNFYIDDGWTRLTFEFQDAAAPHTVQTGRIPVVFRSTDSAAQVAVAIRNAINSAAVQSQLKIQAGNADGVAAGDSTNNRINLFGAAVVANIVRPGIEVYETTTDANALRDVLLGPGVTPVGAAVFTGGAASAGFFRGGSRVIGIDSGIILSTGDAENAEGPNASDGDSGDASLTGDSDLDAHFGVTTEDVTSLEFSFETATSDLFFNFVFASEEYNEFVNLYNDVFAFFIDGENIALVPGTTTPISINTINDAVNAGFYNNNDIDDNGQFLDIFGFDGFTTVLTATKLGLGPGVHTIKLVIGDVDDSLYDTAVFIQAGSFAGEQTEQNRQGITGTKLHDVGDQNHPRDQGQILIAQNTISHSAGYGVLVDAGVRGEDTAAPHPGGVRNLRELNTTRLVPGVTISNNVIYDGGSGGIRFSGETNAAGEPLAPVPYGRIVNNTIYGAATPKGVGISVANNASPTILNNILSGLSQGLSLDATSRTSVIAGNLYHGNAANTNVGVGVGDFAITLAANDPLFVDPAAGNFYLAAGSLAIDSSIDSLEDRPDLVRVTDPLGIARSPILAPDRDVTGQLRVDDKDVEPPFGLGDNVFKDRGAIDRADFVGPTAVLVTPADNDAAGKDKNAAATFVSLFGAVLQEFTVQLVDSADTIDFTEGAGVDDASVTADKVVLTRDGVVLLQGVDYTFDYDATNNLIRLKPLPGVWASGSTYEITFVNSADADGIRDKADNYLRANRVGGETKFTIILGGGVDFGDAPDIYPVTADKDGANHVIAGGLYLGSTVTADLDGVASTEANADAGDDGVAFSSLLRVNTTQTFTVTASRAGGKLDAWIDFNGDGDWDDAGEQIVVSQSLAAGANAIAVPIPITARHGDTYARFRFSTAGGLTPTGQAVDGEVEDYKVTLGGNPWQNPVNPLDVDGNGVVTALDALIVIAELSNPLYSSPSTGDLPVPPVAPFIPGPGSGTVAKYVDVTGSSTPGVYRISPLDALMVINYLIAQANASQQAQTSAIVSPAVPVEMPQSSPTTFEAAAIVAETSPAPVTAATASPATQFSYSASPFSSLTEATAATSTVVVDTGSAVESDEPATAWAAASTLVFDDEDLFDDLGLSAAGVTEFDELAVDLTEESLDDESAHAAVFGSAWA